MKFIRIVLCLLVSSAITCFGQAPSCPKMRFTVHVIGEDGQAIPNVSITLIFDGAVYGSKISEPVDVSTNTAGDFTVEGYSESGTITSNGKGLHKEGYYRGFINTGGRQFTHQDGRWIPWDQTYTTVLRKIGNPIPLYVKKMGADIPVIGVPIGYDLEAADWVAPNGKGQTVDFLVTITNFVYHNNNDSDVSALITFPNEGDGIQEIELPHEFLNGDFKWPREAPLNGYTSKFEARRLWKNIENGKTQIIETSKPTQAYFFRTRTLKQNGVIVSALYGKISGGIGIGSANGKNAVFGFTYYLNPTSNDRNLEFSGKTLLQKIPLDETIRIP